MKIVIELADEIYEMKKSGIIEENINEIISAVIFGKPLPKGHGRLIDADAFIEFLKHKEYGIIDYSDCVIDDITENAPTIIEADREDEE